MNNVVNLKNGYYFRSNNLKRARVLSGLSITDLAEETGISTQSLSKYENSKATPSQENISILSDKLKVPINFFYTDIFDEELENKVGFYRKYSKVSKKDMNKVEMFASLTWVVYSKLKEYIDFPKYTDPVEVEKSFKFKEYKRGYIANIAKKIREKFNIGNGPLLNLTGFLESIGICINYIDLEDLRIDAYTTFIEGVPIVILNSNRISSSRLRFNLAHELGHILFHSNYLKSYQVGDEYCIIEEEANYFAGCLLVPEEGLANDLRAINLEYFISLKSHWQVSVAALVTRSEQTGLISSTHTLHLRQQISRNGWRKLEPLDDKIPREEAVLLRSGVDLVLNKQSNTNSLFAEIPLGAYYFNKVLGITNKTYHNKVQLRLV